MNPTLYQEIIGKFEADGKIPGQLATHLHRFHGITAAASTSAAEIFVQSGRFSGMLDQENRISQTGAPTNLSLESNTPNPTLQPELAQSPPLPDSSNATSSQPILLSASQRFEFSITRGRSVVLMVPSDLNQKDIKIIRKQIELLELQAGLEELEE